MAYWFQSLKRWCESLSKIKRSQRYNFEHDIKRHQLFQKSQTRPKNIDNLTEQITHKIPFVIHPTPIHTNSRHYNHIIANDFITKGQLVWWWGWWWAKRLRELIAADNERHHEDGRVPGLQGANKDVKVREIGADSGNSERATNEQERLPQECACCRKSLKLTEKDLHDQEK